MIIAEVPQTANTNDTRKEIRVLGLSLDWWNGAMIVALCFAALAAVAVVVTTTVVVVLQKRESVAAGQRIAEANVVAALANARAAALEKEAAETRLQYEKLKSAVAWRTITPDDRIRLVMHLSIRPSRVQIEYVRGDPESQQLAAEIREAFLRANWKVEFTARTFLGAPTGMWVLPNATPNDSTKRSVATVHDAFTDVGLKFESTGGAAAERTGEIWGPNSIPVRITVGSRPEPSEP